MPEKKSSGSKKKKPNSKEIQDFSPQSPNKASSKSESSAETKSPAQSVDMPAAWGAYIESIQNHLVRKFQPTIVDEFLKEIEEKGLPEAIACAIDKRDFTRGDIWAKSQADVLSPLLPSNPLLGDLVKQAGIEGSTKALKWLPEYVGSTKDQKEILLAQFDSQNAENERWAAIHLSRLGIADKQDPKIVSALKEGLAANWVASKQEHSSSGLSGKGEIARAIARLGKEGENFKADLCAELEKGNLEAADAAQIASAINQVSQDIELALAKLSVPAESMLKEKRGMGLHQGEKDMLKTLKNFIKQWNQKGSKENKELEAKLEFLEKEIEYHLPN